MKGEVMSSKYGDLASSIIKAVGGKDNIDGLTHCMTRLRFELKDEGLIDQDYFDQETQIISTAHSASKYQVIIGNSVDSVYDEIISQIGSKKMTGSSSKSDENENFLTKVVNVIVKVITPTLNALVAAGLLKGLLAILIACHAITPDSGTAAILNAVGDALFYFFPVILGYTSAETFGLNKFLGMILGGTLIYPALSESMLAGDPVFQMFAGTAFESNAFAKFFGIPVVFPVTGYASTVIPIILINLFASKVEKWLKYNIPDIVGFAFVPFLTLLICAPIGLIVIGPIANLLQSCIGWLTDSLLAFSPVLAAVVVAMIYQPLVIFGLHWPLITIAITNFQTLGYDYLWPMMFTASFAQTAVVLAVALKTKSKKAKSMSVPAIISGLMCIIEPAIYGFSLRDKKRFAFSCIGATVGAIIIALTDTVQYTLGIGLLGFSGFIDPATGGTKDLIIAVAATIISMVVTFALTWFFFTDIDMEEDDQVEDNREESIEIISPVKGAIVPIEEIDDKTFASEVLGKSIAIIPEEGKIVAPFDGVVESLFPTGHAIGLIGTHGESVLIHIGIDTVNLTDKVFEKHINQGETFKKGDVLITFSPEKIKENGFDPSVIVVLTNTKDYKSVEKNTLEKCAFDKVLMKCVE